MQLPGLRFVTHKSDNVQWVAQYPLPVTRADMALLSHPGLTLEKGIEEGSQPGSLRSLGRIPHPHVL